jgi:hypothetical protein
LYCEVFVKHRAVITEAQIQSALRGRLGAAIDLHAAYAMSALYGHTPPAHSLDAFETVRSCFVIVRKVNSRFSTCHIEGNSESVPVQTLLAAVQDFADLLVSVLESPPSAPACRAHSVEVHLYEDNTKQTGIEGKLITLSSVFREQFAWSSLRSSVIAFLTSMALIWKGLKQEPLTASIYSFAIVIVFTLVEAAIGYIMRRGKIRWKFKQE